MADQLIREIVRLAVEEHHTYRSTIRWLTSRLGAPYAAVRRAVYRLEEEGVVRVLRLRNEYVVKMRDMERAYELGYLDKAYLTYGAGFVAPLTAYKDGFYLSDEAYITLPFKIRRHEALDRLLELEEKSRAAMEDALAFIGEWPRFTLLFYRTSLQPADERYVEWARREGLEPGRWAPPAYGFLAFLIYVVRRLTGADWKGAYCTALRLIAEYVKETRAGPSPTEEFVDKVLAEMSRWPCTE